MSENDGGGETCGEEETSANAAKLFKFVENNRTAGGVCNIQSGSWPDDGR